jgi:hypothetical protein
VTSRVIVLTFVIVGIVVGAIGLWSSGPFSNAPAPGQPASPIAASPEAIGNELLPLLERAAADARALVILGESRERNLLRIRAGQEAMNSSLAATDAWLAAHPQLSPGHPAVAAYRHGAAAIREAMDEAQAAFLRFDFDRVGRAVERLRQGAAALEQAIDLLD